MIGNNFEFNKKDNFKEVYSGNENFIMNTENINNNISQNYPIINNKITLSQKLENTNAIYIKQRKNIGKAITGLNFRNNYDIFNGKKTIKNGKEKHKKKGKKLFKVKEISSCFQRFCIPLDCREMKFKIYNYDKNFEDERKKCLKLKKNMSFTFFCYKRPELLIYQTENEIENYLGKIVNPWDCFNYNFIIYNENNEPLYRLKSNCCQCAIWWNGFPCKTCEEAIIYVFSYETNEFITKICKKARNCLNQAIFDTGNYFVPFEENMNWKEKCLLIYATLFIDYQLFQRNDQKS